MELIHPYNLGSKISGFKILGMSDYMWLHNFGILGMKVIQTIKFIGSHPWVAYNLGIIMQLVGV